MSYNTLISNLIWHKYYYITLHVYFTIQLTVHVYFAAAYTFFFTVKKHWIYKALKLADKLSKYYHGIVHAIYSLCPEVGSGCPENLTILIVCVFRDLYILQNMCIFKNFLSWTSFSEPWRQTELVLISSFLVAKGMRIIDSPWVGHLSCRKLTPSVSYYSTATYWTETMYTKCFVYFS